jgi:hypothetical protein
VSLSGKPAAHCIKFPELLRLGTLLLVLCLAATGQPVPTAEPSDSAPDAFEQKRVLSDTTEFVIHHEINLPNFICNQVTRRYQDFNGRSGWRPIDIIVERLTYFDHKEDYKVMEVNGRPSNLPHNQLHGASSSGEFGSVLKGIFAPDTEAQFNWQTWFKLRGRRMYVFSYTVRKDRSNYHIVVPESSTDLVTAYHGLLFIDGTRHFVHRITLNADGVPPSFPIQDVSRARDYEYTRIGDADYLLPLTFELRSREGNALIKNDVDYENYRKFGADTNIRFGEADAAGIK